MRSATIARSLLMTAAFLFAGLSASAQTSETPCGPASSNGVVPGTHGLTLADGGWIVSDSNLGVCWLADANLAGSAIVRALVGLSPTNPDGSTPVINPDGTMDYETALNWVRALNRFNGGKGFLDHTTGSCRRRHRPT